MLADEPTGNLDLETARQVLDVCCRRRAGAGKRRLIMATHSREVAELADRVLSIRNARIEEGVP